MSLIYDNYYFLLFKNNYLDNAWNSAKMLFLQNLKYQIRLKYEPNYEGSIFETKSG